MARLELNNLSKRYGDHAVVAGARRSTSRTANFVLLGPPVAGKTTTLRMIAGFSNRAAAPRASAAGT